MKGWKAVSLKEKMNAYRHKKQQVYDYYMNIFDKNKTYLIQDTNSNMYHIISKSFYDKKIQLTCFIDNKPYNHITFNSYDELFNYDASIFINGYVKDVI